MKTKVNKSKRRGGAEYLDVVDWILTVGPIGLQPNRPANIDHKLEFHISCHTLAEIFLKRDFLKFEGAINTSLPIFKLFLRSSFSVKQLDIHLSCSI